MVARQNIETLTIKLVKTMLEKITLVIEPLETKIMKIEINRAHKHKIESLIVLEEDKIASTIDNFKNNN